MKEITFETKIADLLNDYEGMKDILIKINPRFKKLNNPVLRRTLAKIAGVKQAAVVGGMDPTDLLNQLRVAVGQDPLSVQDEKEVVGASERPSWTHEAPKAILKADEMLEREQNPLAEATKVLKQFEKGEILAIDSDFQPEPLIEAFEKKGYVVYCHQQGKDHFLTYIKKS